ncbi:hypothetical protein AB0M48_24310 [Lentzea sp. NPDC051208]|uniref:hypothetical protein n=1 Tax=Lentzea sp. NPDC051208 TaxID=3154642 RepID=UPI003447DC27
MEDADRDAGIHLGELLAAFSLATDLGLGQPMEHVLRSRRPPPACPRSGAIRADGDQLVDLRPPGTEGAGVRRPGDAPHRTA